MQEAMSSFLVIVNGCFPYSLTWGLGTIAFTAIIRVILGKDLTIK